MKPSTINLDNVPEVPQSFVNNIKDANRWFQWTVMEDIQDHSPYLEFGWYGFVPLILFRS
jgi:hypothetical protein